MIVRMKKISLLCLDSTRLETLETLRSLGVLHLAHVRPPVGADLDQAKERLRRIERALELLPKKNATAPVGFSAAEALERFWTLTGRLKELNRTRENLTKEIRRIEPFGAFDPEQVRKLAEKGVVVKLYQAPQKSAPEVGDDLVCETLHQDKNNVAFVVFGRKEFQIAATEVKLPERPLRQLRAEAAACETEIRDVEKRLADLAGARSAIAKIALAAEDEVHFFEAKNGMGTAAKLAYLQGFCPVHTVESIRRAAGERGWGLLIEEPNAEENVPTLIRNPKWVEPIRTVFDLIGILPGYREIDISASFMFFLSIFFAILVGDAGYGALFLILTGLIRSKLPQAPIQPFALVTTMSVATIVWGVLTGTYFGMEAEQLPPLLSQLRVEWLTQRDNLMFLCFLIGAVHLTVAHAWNAIRMCNSLQIFAQLGWIAVTWTMFFTARTMVLGEDFPQFMFPTFAGGVLLVVLFMTPLRGLRNEWFNHVMLPLTLVGNFVDIVSYLRLFAVGSASFAVAAAFNSMILGSITSPWAWPLAVVLLLLGHTLNIMLAGMGVLVHGVRLNTLEFSSHIGMQWTGNPYRPFTSKTTAAVAESAKDERR
jgi:V/A-type H+-transporting ATPase subunit I